MKLQSFIPRRWRMCWFGIFLAVVGLALLEIKAEVTMVFGLILLAVATYVVARSLYRYCRTLRREESIYAARLDAWWKIRAPVQAL